jgi:hypothetical protein
LFHAVFAMTVSSLPQKMAAQWDIGRMQELTRHLSAGDQESRGPTGVLDLHARELWYLGETPIVPVNIF